MWGLLPRIMAHGVGGGQEPLQANTSLPVVPQAGSCWERLASSAAHPEGTLAPDSRVLQPQVWVPLRWFAWAPTCRQLTWRWVGA